jgi:hypothetical protein
VDHPRLICPHPPSPILPGGFNTSGRSLPHAPPTGCLAIIKNSIPRPMLVAPFSTRNGSNKHFVNTNRPPACCLQNHPGGPILLGARAHVERAYQDWKWAVDELWVHKCHRLQTAACQRLLDKCAAHECQEAARQEAACTAQCLLDEQAALERQEAVRCQRILNEEAASRQRAAQARQMAAARTIFLWLCRRRLHARLACQTLRRQQCEAALARLQHEQECCARVLQAEEQCKQAAAARAKAVANKADERRRQDALAVEQCRRELDKRAAAMAEKALAMEQHHRESAECAAEMAEKALASKRCRRESAEHAAATAEYALAAEQCCQESAERAAATAENALAVEQHCQESAECAAAMAEKALAEEQGLSLSAKMVFAEYDALTIASWDAATLEAVPLGVMALTKLKAAPKLRYGGPPPTHFSPPLTAKEVAKLDATTLDKRHRAATQEKALAD